MWLVGGVGQEVPGGYFRPLVTYWTYAVSTVSADTSLKYFNSQPFMFLITSHHPSLTFLWSIVGAGKWDRNFSSFLPTWGRIWTGVFNLLPIIIRVAVSSRRFPKRPSSSKVSICPSDIVVGLHDWKLSEWRDCNWSSKLVLWVDIFPYFSGGGN